MYPAMLVTSTTRITSDETRNTTARTDLQWKVYLNKIQSSLIIFSIVVSASVKVVFLVVCCDEIFFIFFGGGRFSAPGRLQFVYLQDPQLTLEWSPI